MGFDEVVVYCCCLWCLFDCFGIWGGCLLIFDFYLVCNYYEVVGFAGWFGWLVYCLFSYWLLV